MQCVKPTASLIDVLNNEIGGEMLFKPLFILEWVVDLCKGHRSGLEPAVENFGDPPHHAFACRVVWIWASEVINKWSMEIGWSDSKVCF